MAGEEGGIVGIEAMHGKEHGAAACGEADASGAASSTSEQWAGMLLRHRRRRTTTARGAHKCTRRTQLGWAAAGVRELRAVGCRRCWRTEERRNALGLGARMARVQPRA